MKRGRPKGSGRWTADADARVWARIMWIIERDGIPVKQAAQRLAHEGFLQRSGDGRVWGSRPLRNRLLAMMLGCVRAGDKRNDEPAETLRARYYAAERARRNHDTFRDLSDRWLRHYRARPPSADQERIEITR